ncbi:MAG TPA: ring-cleaving dioxygenase [Thermoanaerobaculia bacterium]|nr:ring-cleaving dioxygenase [Thermoanaerobaculia bacterium]
MAQAHGIHHVTAIAGDAQENLEFYTGVLGARLVKRSVNQDAVDTYHLFYADRDGSPGTDLTFFPWPAMGAGRQGAGQAVEVGFAVPAGSLSYWAERLAGAGLEVEGPVSRFGEETLTTRDPHGLPLAFTQSATPLEAAPWQRSPVPPEHQLRGFHAVRLLARALAPTAGFLAAALGFEEVGEEDGWRRFAVEGGGSSRLIEVCAHPGAPRGAWGTGSVHHVAFRVADDDELQAVRERAQAAGADPTPVIDRFWFHSVYLREPGGALFELATEGPGFAVDEDVETLGERLVLPPWLEPRRPEIEAGLPPLELAAG